MNATLTGVCNILAVQPRCTSIYQGIILLCNASYSTCELACPEIILIAV